MTSKQTLHRAIKILLQRGLAKTVEEAESMLRRYRIGIRVHPDYLCQRHVQVALATLANAGSRVFLGGVFIESLGEDAPSVSQLLPKATVKSSVEALGAVSGDIPDDTPTLLIGPLESESSLDLRLSVNGWSGGVVGAEEQWTIDPTALPLAYILAAGIGLGELFRYHSGDVRDFSGTNLGVSLLELESEWKEGRRLKRTFLPDSVWVLGLGHLGQAYIWSLASLMTAEAIEVYLQDDGKIEPANLSTGVLTFDGDDDAFKTRVVSRWCERLGMRPRLIERRFAGDLRIQQREPRILLSGLDNPETRRLLEEPGFSLVVDGGLSPLGNSYDWFTVKTFTGEGRAREVFSQPTRGITPSEAELSAYREAGLNACGVAELGAVAVGVPFVGLVAATFVIAESIRALAGLPLRVNLAGRVQAIGSLEFSIGKALEVNPGFIEV